MNASEAIRSAQAALRDGDVARGAAILSAAVQSAPADAVLRAAYGELLLVTGAPAAAVVEYEAALNLDPGAHAVRARLVEAALACGHAAIAEPVARQLTIARPSAESWRLLADTLLQQEQFEAALDASARALTFAPTDATQLHAHGVTLAKLGRSEDALACYDSAAAQGADSPAFWFNRHVVLVNLGRLEQAELELATATKAWNNDAMLHTALAELRWMRGAGPHFAETYQRAAGKHDSALAIMVGCADVLRRAGQPEEAESLLHAALRRAPEEPAILSSLALALDEAGRSDEALPLHRRAIAHAPETAVLRGNLAVSLLRMGRGDEALTELAPLRQAEPLNQEWLCYETTALRQLGDPRYHDLCDYARLVGVYDLEPPAGFANAASFNEALAAALRPLQKLAAHPLDQSLRGGSQSTRNLIHVKDPMVQAYLTALDEPIRAYMGNLRDHLHPCDARNSGAYRVAGCWSVLLRAGGYHVNHFHPAGWISSAYYVSLPAHMNEAGRQQGWLKFGEPRWPAPSCGIEHVVEPKPGRVVLFPSYLWHGAISFDRGERLTAPFDVVPV